MIKRLEKTNARILVGLDKEKPNGFPVKVVTTVAGNAAFREPITNGVWTATGLP